MGVLQLQCGSYQFAKSSSGDVTQENSPKMTDLEDASKFGEHILQSIIRSRLQGCIQRRLVKNFGPIDNARAYDEST